MRVRCGAVVVFPEFVLTAEVVEPREELFPPALSPDNRNQNQAAPSEWQTKESRTYQHLSCKEHTTVSEGDHEYVTHVFCHPYETYCVACEKHFPVEEFRWSNTKERLTDYYSRYQSMFSDSEKFICRGSFSLGTAAASLLLGAVVGFLVGYLLSGLTFGIVGAVVGTLLSVGFTVRVVAAWIRSINQRVLGAKEYTELK